MLGTRAEFFCGDASSPHVRQLAQDADVFFPWRTSSPNRAADPRDTEPRASVPATHGRFHFLRALLQRERYWLGRMFMRLDRAGNIKSHQALRALVSEYLRPWKSIFAGRSICFATRFKLSSPGTHARSRDFPALRQIVEEGLRLKIVIAACQRAVVRFWQNEPIDLIALEWHR